MSRKRNHNWNWSWSRIRIRDRFGVRVVHCFLVGVVHLLALTHNLSPNVNSLDNVQLSVCGGSRRHFVTYAQQCDSGRSHLHISIHPRTTQLHFLGQQETKKGRERDLLSQRLASLIGSIRLVFPDVVAVPWVVVRVGRGVVWKRRIARIPVGNFHFHSFHRGISPPPIYTSVFSLHLNEACGGWSPSSVNG